MNRLLFSAALLGTVCIGCQKPPDAAPTAAEKVMAERITTLEEKVERLQQLLVVLDQRKPPVIQPRTVVVANTNGTDRAVAEHQQYEQVMASLADAVENLQQQDQGMAERMQTITDAIISLEQAVLSIDAELRQYRTQP